MVKFDTNEVMVQFDCQKPKTTTELPLRCSWRAYRRPFSSRKTSEGCLCVTVILKIISVSQHLTS